MALAKKDILIVLSAAAAAVVAILLFPAFTSTPWNALRGRSISADMVVMNATIYTSDPSLPFAEAMAVHNGRILRVGNRSFIKDLVGPRTTELNLKGMVVMPGFIDSHVHLISGGLRMGQVDLRGVKSKEEFVCKIKGAVRDKLPGEWVLGGGWNDDMWGGDLPASSWIDDITSHHPVWLSRMDGHMGLANSFTRDMAGITRYTQDPVGGTIIRTASGDPTGLLVDSAMKLVLDMIPEYSVSERREALLRASKYALKRGVTTVVDFGRYFPGATIDRVWQDLTEVYEWADSAGEMTIRICLFFPMQTWSRLVDLIREKGRSLSQWIHFGGVKAFADGSLGSSSALFYEPYEEDPNNYGLQVTDFDWLVNTSLHSDKFGLQLAVHAIGDKANDLVLDIFNTVASLNGIRDRRFRIEHAQHLAMGSTLRFGQQEVIASVQPNHILDDIDSAEKKLGSSRAHTGSYLFQSLLSSHEIAFGSDWPVADINPLSGVKTAMTRMPSGRNTAWIPSERILLNDAINAYTCSAAHAAFLDQELGTITTGKYADFVVVSAKSWEEFREAASSRVVDVVATYVSGMQAYP